jgi:hypothetical protein
MRVLTESDRLRRLTVLTGACTAVLAAPALLVSHHHRALGFACIAAQVVLTALSLRFLALSRGVRER